MDKKDLERTFDDQLWEADSIVEEATGLAQALYDQLDNIIDPITRVDKYADMTNEQVSLVAEGVVSRKKALLTLSGILLDKLARVHKKLQ